ncbi:MAG: AI-2E family transporter [Anaerolineae bacterium]|nr:AI-2E family transporter [Anaerolineae bacterium]
MATSEEMRKPEETPPNRYTEMEWGVWTRRLVTVALIILGVYTITLLQPVLQSLIMALVLAFLLFPLARSLTRRGHFPYALSVVVVFILLFVVLLVTFIVLAPAAVNVLEDVAVSFNQAYVNLYQQLQDYEASGDNIMLLGVAVNLDQVIIPLRDLAKELPSNLFAGSTTTTPSLPGATTTPETTTGVQINLAQIIQGISNLAPVLTGTITSTVTSVFELLIQLILTVFLAFLILLEVPRTFELFIRSIPEGGHREYGLLLDRIIDVWNSFFVGEVVIGFIIAILTWLQLSIMGIPSAFGLAVFTGFISVIPTLGGIIALFPLYFIPVFQGSTVFTELSLVSLGLLVIGVNLVMQQLIWNVVAPKILGDAVSIPLPLIIIGLIIGTAFGGILGAFLVVPFLGTVRVVLAYVLHKLNGRDPYPGELEPAILHKGLFAPVDRKQWREHQKHLREHGRNE